MIRALVLIAALWPGFLTAQSMPALYDVTGVATDDVLNIRAAPRASAEKRGELAPDAKAVEVTALTDDKTWGRVNQGEISGWVAMRFMALQDLPHWSALQGKMSCYGTEPFWGLEVDGPSGNMVLREAATDEPVGLWVVWSSVANQSPGVLGLGIEGPGRTGFATFTATECNDGMSDRQMGLSLSLFLRGLGETETGTVGYSGCCSLQP